MSNRKKRPSKSKTTGASKILCEEKYACLEDSTEAVRHCKQCGTNQCRECDTQLHEKPRFQLHDREQLQRVPTSAQPTPKLPISAAKLPINFGKGPGCAKQIDPVSVEGIFDVDKVDIDTITSVPQNDSSSKKPEEEYDDFFSLNFLSEPPHKPPDMLNGLGMNLDEVNLSDALVDELVLGNQGFPLVDDNEVLLVKDDADFVEKLNCGKEAKVKVVSIFGNTGDGKSHTLNHTFFMGKDVFKTSADQKTGTIGVWAAYDENTKAIVIDTEGLLGLSINQNQRTRLLLKILALSDVVIYCTKADRLHNDMFQFLGDSSKAYLKHFSEELKLAKQRCPDLGPASQLGPSVIIFHETRHTDTLREEPDTYLRERFTEMELEIKAFSSLHYVGVKTSSPETNFKPLKKCVQEQLDNLSVRSPRLTKVILKSFQVLNQKFNGTIERSVHETFPDQYFTCGVICQSCSSRCSLTMNHHLENKKHHSDLPCRFQHQHDNKVFICGNCYETGQKSVVIQKAFASEDNQIFGLVKYAWSGFVLECQTCGTIFRSRKHWYGNIDPENTVVRKEIRHVWPDGSSNLQGSHNPGRHLLDTVGYASNIVTGISAKPVKYVRDWMTDQIAPPYWTPNNEISACHSCKNEFTEDISIHHCRSCGKGFCDGCSSKSRPVPERGWGLEPVRVCDSCYEQEQDSQKQPSESASSTLTSRKVGEAIGSTFSYITNAADYVCEVVKESSRPDYWVPDGEIKSCYVCKDEFGLRLKLHHCRACGNGVCNNCSLARRTVPVRGWDRPVRVCNTCDEKHDF